MSELFNTKKISTKLNSATVVAQSRQYIDDRRKGLITSFKTKYPKLDNALVGGFESNTITCLGAMSGAGKSTGSKTLRDSFITKNPNQKFKQYVFNFEMISHQQIGRSLSSETEIALRDLYSVDRPMTDEEFQQLEVHFDTLSKREVNFIDVSGTPQEIADSIIHYWETECKDEGATIIYEIDHVLLAKGLVGQSEKDRIDDLMMRLIGVKKYIASQGGTSVGIVLSQLNREIKSVERRHNADMHRPDTSCLFGAFTC